MPRVDYVQFARDWIPERIKFFKKDIGICIKDFPESEGGTTKRCGNRMKAA